MRNAFLAILTVFVLALGTPVKARSLEDGLKAYDAGDFSTAFEILLPLAERGNARAQYSLGLMYSNGNGVPQDYEEQMRWYRMAAEQGHAEAQFHVGLLYYFGHGVPQDYELAHMWMNIANANGYADGLKTLMLIVNFTPEQISAAQRRATKCFNSNYQNCD